MKEMMNQKMGTHKFRFSDIMPHSWLYKLKGMRRSSRKPHPSSPKHLSSSDASSTRKLRDPLRHLSSTAHPQAPYSPPKSSSFKRKIKRKTVYKPSQRLKLSSSSSPNSHVSLTSRRSKSSSSANVISDSAVESSSDRVSSPSDQNYSVSRVPKPHYSVDIKDNRSLGKPDDVSEDPSISASLSPLRVETAKEPSFEMMTEQKLKKQNALSSGIKIRAKMARKKTKERTFPVSKQKRTVKSFAIVLSSVDPERDFRESMVEMIMENNMREQKDLEDLLACYLSLNSSEYHDVIIKAFEKTWLHLTHLT